ncbi:hypothetical protein TcBrA4_0054640 [Trypanosoma cruzi]|nr:hypothetical protein TcBrA4_0054640 [Trypanosoma cruzi]
MLTTAAPSNPPPPTNPHRRRTAPPTLHPILQIARRNRREGQWSLSANDARLWYDESPTSPLWAGYMRRADEVAREMCAPSTWEHRMSLAGQFTTFCRTHEQPMILGSQKIAARSEKKLARPLTKEAVDQLIRNRTDWKERVVFDLHG